MKKGETFSCIRQQLAYYGGVMKTNNTTYQIKSHHTSLASAVEEAKPDLSYNPAEARRDIALIDGHCKQALVLESGDIYYVYSADINLLHKYEPFISCIHDTPFAVAFIVGNLLTIGQPRVPKTKEGRAWFKTAAKKFDALAA